MKDSKIVDIDYIKTGDELYYFINDNDYTPVLSEYETRLNNDHKKIVDKLNEIKKSISTLIDVNIFVGRDSAKDSIENIKSTKDKIEKSIVEFMKILGEKQSSCDHEHRNIGHDSHYDYYICDKCGLQERW